MNIYLIKLADEDTWKYDCLQAVVLTAKSMTEAYEMAKNLDWGQRGYPLPPMPEEKLSIHLIGEALGGYADEQAIILKDIIEG